MDRISHLPESILHRILSSLNSSTPAELVRIGALSKTWFDLTASFPILDFNIRNFGSRESFFKYVEYTTSRFCHQNVTAHKFKIITTVDKFTELDTINRCLELVLKNGVRELVVDVYSYRMPKYRLPDILSSVSVLESLTIHGCELPSSLMADAVKFKSLTELRLVNVHIDDEAIKYLTTSCPLLQNLNMLSCYGFKSFCVSGHQNLQQISIDYSTPVERIDIEAPNLSHLWVQDTDYRGAPRMNVASCKKLTTVFYYGYPIPNDFVSNFPFVENLRLVTEDICNNLKLSSHSLRTLVLEADWNLDRIELDTPNLVLFMYSALWPTVTDECWPLLRGSTNMKSCMQCYPDRYVDALWFQKLRLFLDKKNGFKVSNLHIHMTRERIELEELNAIELPPYELEHVELQLDTGKKSSDHVAFVADVLLFFRPRSLTLISSFPSTEFEEQSDDAVKIICEKLLQQEDQGHTNLQFVSCPEGKTTRFIKKQVVQEEAG